MNRYLWFLLCLSLSRAASADGSLLGVSNPADLAGRQGWGAYAAAHYFEANDYIAVREFSHDWGGDYSPRSGKNTAMQIIRGEAGASLESWRLATLYRKEILLESNRDTTDMAYFNKTRLRVPAGQTFGVDLRIQGFEADGIRLDKGFVLPSTTDMTVSVGVGASLLRGKRVRIGRADGTASSTVSGYAYNVALEDSNSKATYPFIRDAAPIGQGYAFDLGTRIAWANGARLELAANDLAGKIRWENMPHTLLNANSNTIARDASGFITFNPAISGVNDVNRRSIEQKLDPKLHAQAVYPIGKFDVFAGTDWTKGYWFPQAGVAYRFDANWKTMLDYDARFKTLGWRIAHKWFYLSLRSESATLDKAKAYGAAAGLNVSF